MATPLRIGLIGAGMMGADHARTIARSVPGAGIEAVHDFDVDRAGELAAELGAKVVGSAAELFTNPDIDAILVASPDQTHAPLARLAAAAGKPMLCEKPLGTSAQESQSVVDAEVAAGRQLVTVGFMRRFDPGYVALKERLSSGTLGEPRLVHNVHRNRVGPPAVTTDGIVVNSMIHELDIVPWLVDSRVSSIQITSPVQDGLRDPQLAVLHLADGTVSTIEVFIFAAYGYDVRCEVVGTAGTAALNSPAALVEAHDGMRGRAIPADFRLRFREAYRLELEAWAEATAAGRVIGPTAWDGHLANLVAAAGVEAITTGERVSVPAPERPDLYR